MRSLLEVRQGEVACIRIPAELMESIIGKENVLASSLTPEVAARPGIHGRVSREWAAGKLMEGAATGTPVQGKIQTPGQEDFEWSNSRWKIEGKTYAGTHDVTLQLAMHEGGGDTIFMTTVANGDVILLCSAMPDPEGLPVVVGKNAEK